MGKERMRFDFERLDVVGVALEPVGRVGQRSGWRQSPQPCQRPERARAWSWAGAPRATRDGLLAVEQRA